MAMLVADETVMSETRKDCDDVHQVHDDVTDDREDR